MLVFETEAVKVSPYFSSPEIVTLPVSNGGTGLIFIDFPDLSAYLPLSFLADTSKVSKISLVGIPLIVSPLSVKPSGSFPE